MTHPVPYIKVPPFQPVKRLAVTAQEPRNQRMNRPRIAVLASIAAAVAAFGQPAQAVSHDGGLTLHDVMALYAFSDYSVYGHTILFRSRYRTVVFENGSRKAVVDGVAVYLNGGIDKYGPDWVVRPVDAAGTLGPLLNPDPTLAKVSLGTVIIDPGHGGKDPGTRTIRLLEEKRLTLDLAKRLRLKLQACGVNAALTRDRDTFIELDERCGLAARQKADLFVSIHLNASGNLSISGVETYIVPAAGYPSTADAIDGRRMARPVPCPGNRFDGANLLLAYYIHRGVLSQTGAEDRGVRRAHFFVIRNAPCPAALVECGFLSNVREAAHLSTEPYRDQVAEGLARGILTYLVRAREARLPPARAD